MYHIVSTKVNIDNLPLITVIVTAYNRREYINEAINSVLSQNFDLMNVELIIITNFEFNFQITLQNINRYKIINLDGDIGEFLFTAISESSGEIIVFLDDDDMFDNEKLKYVNESFSTHRTLCYYHNSLTYINKTNEEIKYNRLVENKVKKNIDLYVDKNNISNHVNKILDSNGDFNMSCIAIRKKYYTNYLSLLRQITGATDAFFFWISIITMGDIFIEKRKLTQYRVHPNNVSVSMNYVAKIKELEREEYTFSILIAYLQGDKKNCSYNNNTIQWLNMFKSEYKLIRLFFSISPRKEVIYEVKSLFKYPLKIHNILRKRLILMSVIYIMMPHTTIKIYEKI